MATFTPRLTRPEKGNPYYNTKAAGGYSTAVKGSPTDSACNVLHNCVGYAFGRFNEIIGEKGCNYLKPVNAELFIQYKGTLTVGQTPRVGAVMVWQKGNTLKGTDGAGHVAIVEKVVSDTEVVTSESGWQASKAFWTQTRKKGTGNWGQTSPYKFLGFIYNPAPCCQSDAVAETPAAPAVIPTKTKASGVAKYKNSSLSGTYIVSAFDGLNLRDDAGTGADVLVCMPISTKFRNYGYYSLVGNTKWLYGIATVNNVTYTGFASMAFLKK